MMRLHNGDCLNILKMMIEDEVFVDSIVTDPPYELGFMGRSWDSTGIAFQKETWELCFKVLKPGGHLLAFSGSRTYHRMAVAIEDAGFEIRDQVMWLYGSGFPKSMNVGKALDKKLGNERESFGTKLKKAGFFIILEFILSLFLTPFSSIDFALIFLAKRSPEGCQNGSRIGAKWGEKPMKIRLGLEMASGGDLGSILVRFLIDFRSFSVRFGSFSGVSAESRDPFR